MKKYVLFNDTRMRSNNAGGKAGRDAVAIACSAGYAPFRLYSTGERTRPADLAAGLINALRLAAELRKGDIVLVQYPMNRELMKLLYRLLNRRGAHVVTLIHDIDYLRDVPRRLGGVDGMRELELALLSQSEYLICHNPSMIAELRHRGIESKCVSLELFDYLYDGGDAANTGDNTVIVAGNLAKAKAGYLYKLHGECRLALFGSNLDEGFTNDKAEYYGSFPPDVLIENLKGDYGLVWDGDETETCAGPYGEYLRYNDPHKASLYLAAGLPVIVWKQSALYPLVDEHGIGVGVDSLAELGGVLRSRDYREMKENVMRFRDRVRGGGFLTRCLTEIEKGIQSV